MYLHNTGSGQTLLYLEQDSGQTLAILDVANPARIEIVGRVSVPAPSPYDFVRPIDDYATLIQYRDQSGIAVVDFTHYKQPTLIATPEFPGPATAEVLGRRALLVESTNGLETLVRPERRYRVIQFSNSYHPAILATIEGVRQRLARPATGTLFFLGDKGLTVLRRPDIEEEYRIHEAQKNQN